MEIVDYRGATAPKNISCHFLVSLNLKSRFTKNGVLFLKGFSVGSSARCTWKCTNSTPRAQLCTQCIDTTSSAAVQGRYLVLYFCFCIVYFMSEFLYISVFFITFSL